MRTEIQKREYKFVINELKEIRKQLSICNLKYISKNYSKYISDNFMMGNSMMSLIYIIQYILKIQTSRSNFFKKIVKWFQNPEKLYVNSTQSLIYISFLKFRDIKLVDIILKIDKITSNKNSYREYYIAYTELNKLRYLVPNFMMTYGQFKCLKPSVNESKIQLQQMCKPKGNYVNYTLYERISGITLETYLNSDDYSHLEFVNIFIQILFALEISQQQCGFTHFDLHHDNIVLRKSDSINQSIFINGLEYVYKTGQYIPVIIDYGHSCVRKEIDGKWGFIGYGEFPEYGMMNFMISGYDMYKIMSFCIYAIDHNKSKENTENTEYAEYAEYAKTLKMFHKIYNFFYGIHEPYHIFMSSGVNSGNVDDCISEFCKMGTYSMIANRTPSELIDFMIKYKIINNINTNFQRTPIPYQKNMSVRNILEKYTKTGKSGIVYPNCELTYTNNKLSSVYYYVSNLCSEIESQNNIHKHISLSLIYFLADLPSDSNYSQERKLLQEIPSKLKQLKLECEINNNILNISLKKSLELKLDSNKRKQFLKKYNQLVDLFQLYYMIKYNHHHFKNKFDALLNVNIETEWNNTQQHANRISRWYESLIYFQYVEYTNSMFPKFSSKFSDSYFESFDILKF